MRSAPLVAAVLAALSASAASQQIWDIWQTTWNRSPLFQYNPSSMGSLPINFVTPGPIASADIVVNDSAVYQSVWGFGASLTDSSALLMSQLKSTNSANYWTMLLSLFNSTDSANSAGFNYLRVPLGASDFSNKTYSYDDTSGDTGLYHFNISVAPSYVFSTIRDIISINPLLRVHVLPWSPPGWMKNTSTMDGGSLQTTYESVYAQYLLKSLQGFQQQGIPIYAIGIQNEPENSDSTYPTTYMPAAVEAAIALELREIMDNTGFACTKIIGYEHNWDDAAGYPITLMEDAESAFDGVAFHCYAGSVSEQAYFTDAYPDKEVYFTECSGTIGSDWWSDIKWYMDNLFIGSISYGASSGLMWNLALNGSGLPKLPGTDSCGGANGCRGVVQINSNGTYSFNQEYYAMAQASKAILPRDVGGPWGQRIGVTVGGTLDWTLVVGAYVTGRVNSTDWLRYSLVVLNWYDNASTTWDPIPVNTTIEFRGMQAVVVFPVGVTTLWWYAESLDSVSSAAEETVSASCQRCRPNAHASRPYHHKTAKVPTPINEEPFILDFEPEVTGDVVVDGYDDDTTEFGLGMIGTIFGEMADGRQVPLGVWQ